MTEYFRITGRNLIPFDALATGAADERYHLKAPPGGMDEPMTEAEVKAVIGRLPQKIRGHALKYGLSKITFPFTIQGSSDPDMEGARHDVTETLEDGQLYIETKGARGTQAVLQSKSDNAVNQSYKTIIYGEAMELGGRAVLGAPLKDHWLENLQMVLYCEKLWRPETRVPLGPNEIYCPGLEEDGDDDGTADNWTLIGAPTDTMESTIVLQGFYSQKLVTQAAIGDGIKSTVIQAPAVGTSAVCYAWIARPAAAPSDITVQLYREGVGVVASALYDAGGWDEATAKDGVTTFYRVEISSAAGITPAQTYSLRISNTQNTITTFYVDKCFWKWGTTTVPDEWCDHFTVYNHYDTTAGAGHAGHQNYFDVADLKGDVEARLLVRVQHAFVADLDHHADLIAARRSWWDYPEPDVTRDMHWLEAEDADTQTQWADMGGLVRCSAGECVEDDNVDAHTSGSVEWDFFNPLAVAPRKRTNSLRGRWDVFGVVYTDDEANTMYRLSHTNLAATRTFYNTWVRQTLPDQWQLTYLGEINLDKYLRDNQSAHDCSVTVEYAKQAADTVRLDCIWLLPKSEPETRLHVPDDDWGYYVYDLWVFSRDGDFDYQAKEEWSGAEYLSKGELYLQGDDFSLTPRRTVGQRLYMSIESVDTVPVPDERVWEAHGAGTLRLRVDISYLPQYLSPLD